MAWMYCRPTWTSCFLVCERFLFPHDEEFCSLKCCGYFYTRAALLSLLGACSWETLPTSPANSALGYKHLRPRLPDCFEGSSRVNSVQEPELPPEGSRR